METRVRTTITIPQELLETAKTLAFSQKTTVSHLVREGLERMIFGKKPHFVKKKFSKFVGGRTVGIKRIKRENIYEDYLREKMSP